MACKVSLFGLGPTERLHLPLAVVVAALAFAACSSRIPVAPKPSPLPRAIVSRGVHLDLLRERAQMWRFARWTPVLRGLRLLYDIPVRAGPTLGVVRSVVRANHRLDPFDALVLASRAVAVAREHRLDYGFFSSTLLQESAFAPDALSAAGAVGIAQFTLETAHDEGVDPFDWADAMEGCAGLLGRYVASYDGVYADPFAAALAAYNAGPGTVAYYHGVPPYSETKAYVADVYDRWARILHDAEGDGRRRWWVKVASKRAKPRERAMP